MGIRLERGEGRTPSTSSEITAHHHEELRAQIANLMPHNAPRDDSGRKCLEPAKLTLLPLKVALLVGDPENGYVHCDPR